MATTSAIRFLIQPLSFSRQASITASPVPGSLKALRQVPAHRHPSTPLRPPADDWCVSQAATGRRGEQFNRSEKNCRPWEERHSQGCLLREEAVHNGRIRRTRRASHHGHDVPGLRRTAPMPQGGHGLRRTHERPAPVLWLGMRTPRSPHVSSHRTSTRPDRSRAGAACPSAPSRRPARPPAVRQLGAAGGDVRPGTGDTVPSGWGVAMGARQLPAVPATGQGPPE